MAMGGFSGGGGSRTRVREPIHQNVYVRIALLCSLPVPARARPFRASCLGFSSSMRQAPPSDQPEFASSSRVASGGLLKERTAAKVEPYAAIARLSLAVVLFSRSICEVPGPRHAASTSPNTSKPWRPLLGTATVNTTEGFRSSSPGRASLWEDQVMGGVGSARPPTRSRERPPPHEPLWHPAVAGHRSQRWRRRPCRPGRSGIRPRS